MVLHSQSIVRQEWADEINGCAMYKVIEKLRRVKAALKDLRNVGFGDVEACVIQARQYLVGAQNAMHDNS